MKLVVLIATSIFKILENCVTSFRKLADQLSLSFKSITSLSPLSPKKLSIVEFYQGAPNDKGVTLSEIWSWDYKKLEDEHLFIQWLFPTFEQGVNPTAPITDSLTRKKFQKDEDLQAKMLKSFTTMLGFYGFVLSLNNEIEIGYNFPLQSKIWLRVGNHNYRRITRILTSLRLHGLEKYAKEFFKVLQEVYRNHSELVGASTMRYWENAMKDSV